MVAWTAIRIERLEPTWSDLDDVSDILASPFEGVDLVSAADSDFSLLPLTNSERCDRNDSTNDT